MVPAFARAAARGEPLRIEGADHTFDFTHLSDTVAGILLAIDALEGGENRLPPLHLLSGTPTTLAELAKIAAAAGGDRSPLLQAPPRSYDVSRFYGDPTRAMRVLGFRARIGITDGMARMVQSFSLVDAVPVRVAAGGV